MNTQTLLSFLAALCALESLVVFEGILAYHAGMFSPRQMRCRGIPKGLPFIMHGGAAWGDPLIVSPVLAFIAATYGHQWAFKGILIVGAIAFVLDHIIHKAWSADDKFADSLTNRRGLTRAGRFHWIYQGIGFWIIGLFYFATLHIEQTHLIVISVLLGIHVVLGMNKQLDVIKPRWWIRRLTDDIPGWIVIGVTWALLYWRCHVILSRELLY